MNDPFDPTSTGFTPREPLMTQGSMTGNPWTNDYKMNHVVSPSANAFASSFNSPTSNSNSPSVNSPSVNPGSFNSGIFNPGIFNPGSLNAGSLNAGTLNASAPVPNLNSVGLSAMGTIGSRGIGSSVNSANLTLNTGGLNSGNPNYPLGLNSGLNSISLSSSAMPASAATNSVNSNSSTSNSATSNSGTSNSAVPHSTVSHSAMSKPGWHHSAFSPGSTFSREKAPSCSKESFQTTTTFNSPTSRKQIGQNNMPGLLPNDNHNDTFVMDMDDDPEDVIAELKLQVESLITAIVMAKSQSHGVAASSALQGADGIEVAHRIMNRLKALRQENEYLGKLTSGARAAELEAKNQILERENAMLKQQVNEIRHNKEHSKN